MLLVKILKTMTELIFEICKDYKWLTLSFGNNLVALEDFNAK